MIRGLIATVFFLLTPLVANAAVFSADRNVTLSTPPEDNVYVFGSDVRVLTPLPEDLGGVGGRIIVSAPIAGDAFLMGGTISLQEPIEGDVRTVSGQLSIQGAVQGDILAVAGSVVVSGKARNAWITAGTVEMFDGSTGPVTIYASQAMLGGEYGTDVTVSVSDKLTIAENTIIRGVLRYDAPQEALIPASAVIEGGVVYTGSSSFLPTIEEAKAYAIAGLGIFFVVRLLAVLLVAVLVSGLFPRLVHAVAKQTVFGTRVQFFKSFLYGLCTLVLVPFALILLFISFVGIGIGLLLGPLFFFAILFSYVLGGILLGAFIARVWRHRSIVSMKSAVMGIVLLQIVGLIPVIGGLVVFVLSITSLGGLLYVGYRFAFHDRRDIS